jgi:predicted O-methyltransferase YrrM
MEPFARQELAEAGNREQTILLSLDQTDLVLSHSCYVELESPYDLVFT